MSPRLSKKWCIPVAILIGASTLVGCGADKQSLVTEACGYFVRGTDRLNVDDTAYDSYRKAYKLFERLSKEDSFFIKFANVAYELSEKDGPPVAWTDIDEVAAYCGDPVFED